MITRENVARVENKLRNLDLSHLTERLWAYLTIQKLLETMEATSDETVKANAKTRALEMSIKVIIFVLHASAVCWEVIVSLFT